ncbi:uncharacterized protein LOC118348588 [Juglans regia]|uniref:Uncharacterized protein LOC118348588 n=1 Tax=Juglans regia TaxID=51240 RepID=A0A6P9EE30_JUGRE|nr:uncharacterized protein LOC118348588 [Juglans regia]
MNCLSWNCQGLGNPRIVNNLQLMVQNKSPKFVFLMETKCNRFKLETVKRQLKFDNSFVVDSIGARGGLAFLWKEEAEAEVVSYTQHHISLIVKEMRAGGYWILTDFYGNPITSKRHESWKLLQALTPTRSTSWVCIGDFNEILRYDEKWGGPLRPYNQMEAFREAVCRCGLNDMGFNGGKFTWSNGRYGKAFTKERLDRAFCNNAWANLFVNSKVYTLPTLNSDHSPLWIVMDLMHPSLIRSQRPCRFEAWWTLKASCFKAVEEAWDIPRVAPSKILQIVEGLKYYKQKLSQWSNQQRVDHKREVKEQLKLISTLQDRNTGHLNEEIKQVQKRVDSLLEAKNLKWKQRARKSG